MTKVCQTYHNLKKSKKRVHIEQGGTRSGKTYSILQVLIEWCWNNKNSGTVISLCKETTPDLKRTLMRDFFSILESGNVYDVTCHNKTDKTYKLWGNLIEFLAFDQEQKAKGSSRDILFLNECDGFDWNTVTQLIQRTRRKIILDFNPSGDFWVYERFIEDDGTPKVDFVEWHKTTYLDNPHLPKEQIEYIESYKDLDPYFWKVYGLGEKGVLKGLIFRQPERVPEMPNGLEIGYGLDFGFSNDPTALVKVGINRNGDLISDVYIQEIVYETGLTNQDISNRMNDLDVSNSDAITCDSAEPKSIEELHRLGWNVHEAVKGADSVRNGIDLLKSCRIYIVGDSPNIIKEFKNYKWKEDKNGEPLAVPVDRFNHAIDAVRYDVMKRRAFKQTIVHFF